VHTVHADPAILFNYGDRSSATDAVKRHLVDFLGREDAGALLSALTSASSSSRRRARRRANSLRAEGEKL